MLKLALLNIMKERRKTLLKLPFYMISLKSDNYHECLYCETNHSHYTIYMQLMYHLYFELIGFNRSSDSIKINHPTLPVTFLWLYLSQIK